MDHFRYVSYDQSICGNLCWIPVQNWCLSRFIPQIYGKLNWLVVQQPSWKIWVRQWEGLSHIIIMENKIHVWNHQPVKDRSMATMWLSLTCWRLTSIPSEYVSENDEVASVSGRKATMKNHWRHNKIASITNSLYWPINHYLSFISWGFRRPSTRTALVCLLHWHVDHRRGLDQFQQHSDAHSDDHECIYCIYMYTLLLLLLL